MFFTKMDSQIEASLIKRFIAEERQARYLQLFAKDKSRKKFTQSLYHFKDFNLSLFREVLGSEDPVEAVVRRLGSVRILPVCYVISANSRIDGQTYPLDEALRDVVGQEATILIFGDLEVVYYEGEAPGNRYISL